MSNSDFTQKLETHTTMNGSSTEAAFTVPAPPQIRWYSRQISITPLHLISFVLVVILVIGFSNWLSQSRIRDLHEDFAKYTAAQTAAHEVESNWIRSDLSKYNHDNQMNAERLQTVDSTYKQVIGYMQGKGNQPLAIDAKSQ